MRKRTVAGSPVTRDKGGTLRTRRAYRHTLRTSASTGLNFSEQTRRPQQRLRRQQGERNRCVRSRAKIEGRYERRTQRDNTVKLGEGTVNSVALSSDGTSAVGQHE
jgi:hypothetical protein